MVRWTWAPKPAQIPPFAVPRCGWAEALHRGALEGCGGLVVVEGCGRCLRVVEECRLLVSPAGRSKSTQHSEKS